MASILPKDDFDAEIAARDFKQAMKGFGTDEELIIDTLVGHSLKQRLETADAFKTLYGEDLIEGLKSEVSGDFEDTVVAMLTKPAVYDAKTLKAAMKGAGTDEATLIEVLCGRSNDEIDAIKAAYKTEYDGDLESDLQSETSGCFKRLLVSQCNASRSEDQDVDDDKAQLDAQAIFDAGESQWGTDEAEIQAILCSRSYPQLRATFQAYQGISEKDMEDAIKAETSGSLQSGYLAIVRYAKSPSAFFAERLYEAMKGLGTEEDAVTRIIVTRSEVDMRKINKAFHEKYEETLRDFLDSNVSGDYRRLLMKVCGFDEEDE